LKAAGIDTRSTWEKMVEPFKNSFKKGPNGELIPIDE
jgi:hypothetical protein